MYFHLKNVIAGKVEEVEPLRKYVLAHVTINGKIKITTKLGKTEKAGDDIVLSVDPEKDTLAFAMVTNQGVVK